MRDIITIGSGTRDVFLVSNQFTFIKSDVFETGVGECVSLGSKIELDAIIHTTGGGATNAATTFARLGYKTATICRVGDDNAGRDLIIDLQRDHVDTTLVRRVRGGATGYSTLLTTKGGERSVLVYRGVSGTFTAKDIPLNECEAKWIYLTSLGGNLALSKRIIRHAAACHASIAWNPGRGEIEKGFTAFRDVLKYVSVFNMNKEEAQRLTKETDIKKIFKKLATPGNIVIITNGDKGTYAHHDGETVFANTTKVKAISRTGAGDAFGSGFVAAYAKTKDLHQALAVATINAESVIRHIGAKEGILKAWPTAKAIQRIPIKII